jgi:hypothetical protein
MTLGQSLQYLRQCWLQVANRSRVMEGYRVLGVQHHLTLTDIALRNGVFIPSDSTDPHRIAYENGRRDCALEIFNLAKVDPALLHSLQETKPVKPS